MLENINNKYSDSIQDQETMKDIIDYTFFKRTRPFVFYQVAFYVIFFVVPYLI
jgi:hypothetical protein